MTHGYFEFMSLSFKCENLVRDCKWSTSANSMSDLMRKINSHADHRHDKMLTSEDKMNIQASIKSCN